MAYKLYGISKPNTFVSSFVRKAEGRKPNKASSKADKHQDAVHVADDLDEEWKPSYRGLYSLCFKTRIGNENGLITKEVWLRLVTQFDEVQCISHIFKCLPVLNIMRNIKPTEKWMFQMFSQCQTTCNFYMNFHLAWLWCIAFGSNLFLDLQMFASGLCAHSQKDKTYLKNLLYCV